MAIKTIDIDKISNTDEDRVEKWAIRQEEREAQGEKTGEGGVRVYVCVYVCVLMKERV
jgi:hypothetical protein